MKDLLKSILISAFRALPAYVFVVNCSWRSRTECKISRRKILNQAKN